MIVILIGLIIGVLIGMFLPITFTGSATVYVSVVVLAAINTLFAAIKANLQDKLDQLLLLGELFVNVLMALFLAYIGEQLGLPLYFAALFVFGSYLFEHANAVMRLMMTSRQREKK